MSNGHRIVSSDEEQLILVDTDDNETGYLSKAACHDGGGILHRAFSVFLFNDEGELLLQQRAASKRLWPGFWSNSCCSHPRRGESMPVATRRRLRDELNLEAELEFAYRFAYQADFDEAGAEHELCHVYLGRCAGSVNFNRHEIDSIRRLSRSALEAEFKDTPDAFTPWFKMEWQTLAELHAGLLARHTQT